MKTDYDFIIVGSGFGGSVSALRLSEKGYKVLVIEKGKNYKTKDFPKTNWDIRKYLWFPSLFLYGIQALTFLKHVFVLHGVGVGGGSLVYANTLRVPPDNAFNNDNWPDKKWKDRLLPFYDLAKKMLGATPAKKLGATDNILKDSIDGMYKDNQFQHVDVGVFFGEQNKEVSDPYFNGKGPNRSGCTLCSGCMVGCRHNAKNTLDKNYLYLARGLGATILPENEVLNIEQTDFGYKLTLKKSTGIIRKYSYHTSKNVILSGGVMGSVKLLLKCKKIGSLPNISNMLGDFVRTNSESILGVKLKNYPDQDFTDGISISASAKIDSNTHVEMVRFGKGQNSLSILTTILGKRINNKYGIIYFIKSIIKKPLSFLRLLYPLNWAEKSILLLVMQPIDNYLKLDLKRSFIPFFKKKMYSMLPLNKPIKSQIESGDKLIHKISEDYNGTAATTYMDALFGIPTTAHILGGCKLGKDIKDGVINDKFEVFNYPGLFVVDGSVVPSNLGVNPSLTITALSEYFMSTIPAKKND